MEAVEHDEKYSAAWRKAEDALGAEAIRLDQAILEGSNCILLLLVPTIERGKIKIR